MLPFAAREGAFIGTSARYGYFLVLASPEGKRRRALINRAAKFSKSAR